LLPQQFCWSPLPVKRENPVLMGLIVIVVRKFLFPLHVSFISLNLQSSFFRPRINISECVFWKKFLEKKLRNIFFKFFPNLNYKNFKKHVSKILYKDKKGKTEGRKESHRVRREKFLLWGREKLLSRWCFSSTQPITTI
jgi:hypothetical protein